MTSRKSVLSASAEQILKDVVNEAEIAFNAEIGFLEWRAGYQSQAGFFAECNERCAEWVRLVAPYARSYRRIADHLPEYMGRFVDIALPIQREIFGTE
jgi:hypothetical protein